MRHLSKIFEARGLNGITQKLLIDNNLTEYQYMSIIKFVGNCEYSEVNDSIPFLIEMFNTDDYNIGSGNLQKLMKFYNIKKRI